MDDHQKASARFCDAIVQTSLTRRCNRVRSIIAKLGVYIMLAICRIEYVPFPAVHQTTQSSAIHPNGCLVAVLKRYDRATCVELLRPQTT